MGLSRLFRTNAARERRAEKKTGGIFFGFFVCEKTNKPALTDKQENQIITDAQSKARDQRNKGNIKIIKEVRYKKRFLRRRKKVVKYRKVRTKGSENINLPA